jgi:glycosyltransferase involved in cell wall biosynthesis
MSGVLVHEWISQAGGSENVLEAMSNIYPDADIFCLWNDSRGRFADTRVKESWLARTPLRRCKSLALPLMPVTWRALQNKGYDWALISSHLFAHHARFADQPDGFRRYVYVHTPARYIWNPELDARGSNVAARAVSKALRPLDRKRANESGSFSANSRFVRDRMRAAWGIDAQVIYPPVAVERIQSVVDWRTQLEETELAALAGLPRDFVLGASRFIPYKRLDLVIKTGERVGLPVVLAGKGPELPVLRELAVRSSVPVHFVLAPSDAMLYALYQRTSVFVFPAVEDFGIMPVEAMAAGAPVLAQAVGGTAETVAPGRTGALICFESADDLKSGIEQAIGTSREDRLDRARGFSMSRFSAKIADWVVTA